MNKPKEIIKTLVFILAFYIGFSLLYGDFEFFWSKKEITQFLTCLIFYMLGKI